MQQPPCNGVDFTISFRFRLSENADTFLFGGWSNNLEWTSNRSKAPPKWCLFSIPPPSQDYSFPFGLDREGLEVVPLACDPLKFVISYSFINKVSESGVLYYVDSYRGVAVLCLSSIVVS